MKYIHPSQSIGYIIQVYHHTSRLQHIQYSSTSRGYLQLHIKTRRVSAQEDISSHTGYKTIVTHECMSGTHGWRGETDDDFS